MAPIDLAQAVNILGKYLDLTNTGSTNITSNQTKSANLGTRDEPTSLVGAPATLAAPSVDVSQPSAALTSSSGAAAAPALIPQASPVPQAAAVAPIQKGRSAWIQWMALFSGILIQPFFQAYQKNNTWSFEGFGGWTLFALITSVVIFPGVYKRAFDQDSPALVQLAPIFTAGLGWQSLLTTAIKLVSHPGG